MKFYQSTVLANLDQFRIGSTPTTHTMLSRERVDMFLLWKTIEYFRPKKMLEIGFFAGQSAGIMLESAGPDADLTAVDINMSRQDVFLKLFSASNIKFINTDSMLLDLNHDEKFDFISIDGNHDYKYVLNDLIKCLPCMHKDTILHMDDYPFPGVEKVICDHLLGQHDFVPFMFGDQSMFFHHISHSADEFIDSWIQDKSSNFIYFKNTVKFEFLQLRAKLSNIFVDHPNMFRQSLEFYQL